ncbi:MAG TPA: FAD-binding oxidoreductase [Candidatus Limnocylindria bacterium]|nr:FAD-binding oxidoreductase [Candidatus Limnocylindria bacterium]
MSTPYPYNGRLRRWEEVADGLAIVGITSNDAPFAFSPGQYATLGLAEPAGKLIQRPMSISSSADDTTEYEFFIRLVHGGAFTTLLWDRRVGDPINIKGPKGRFLLQDDGRTCLFVASGTGLAPFMSMLDTLRDRGRTRDVVLLHGVSYDYDLAWRGELEALAASGSFPLRYAGTVSRPAACPDWHGLTGRVESVVGAQLDAHALSAANATIYLCGNPDMIEAVDRLAAERGFGPEQVRKELYWPKGRGH